MWKKSHSLWLNFLLKYLVHLLLDIWKLVLEMAILLQYWDIGYRSNADSKKIFTEFLSIEQYFLTNLNKSDEQTTL